MILTQTHKRRSFVGSLNFGTDVVDALRSLCVDNTILCGSVRGTGYLKDVKLRTFDAVTRSWRDPVTLPGTFHVASLQGTISLIERQTSIRCHVLGSTFASGAPIVMSGEIISGEVASIEFELDAIDDIRLFRARDERSGLDAWLHVEFAQAGAPVRPPERIAPPEPPPVEEAPVRGGKAPKAADTGEIREGDFLNHPTLGRCVVAGPEVDERLTIRLESGRLVELHTGLIDISPARPGPGGERVFNVAIKRRR